MTYEEFTQRYTCNPNLDRIGNGKFGTFYKAYDNLLHREVTIKKVLTEANSFYPEAYYWSDFVFTINLKDEYEVLKRIPKHKNIAYYDEHYSFDGYEYAILPYQVESDLCDLMQQNLTMEQKESISLQLLDGLDFLHKHQIYGCFDPWNVLMIKTRDGFAPIITNLGVKPQVVNMSCEAFGLPRFINHQFYSYPCEHSDVEMYVIILYELFTGRILSKDAENKIDYSCSEPERAFAAKGLRELIARISDPWKEIISSFFSLVGGLNTQDIFDVINTYNSPELEVIEADVIQPDKNHPNAINGYTLQYQLGEGGMAEVWYAENKIGKKAAVKMLSPKFCGDGVIVARFENEARVMVRLEHPNIRQVYDYATVDDRPCIIMEYLEGNDLKSMMKFGYHFSDDELVKWWNQMVQALNYTHKMGVVHRDIKPSNIFIDNQGNVKLLDFGIAKNDDNAANTLTGSTMGTLLYMSPEQVKDPKRVGYKTDLYSLAVTFVHLITGKAPYDSTNSSNFEIQMNIVRKPLDISALPSIWHAFLEPYLGKDPKNRPELMEFIESPFVDTGSNLTDDETIIDNKPNTDYYTDFVTENDKGDLVFNVKGVFFVMKKVEGDFIWIADYDDYGNRKDYLTSTGININSFYMGETPITQALWTAVMGNNPSEFKGDELPVDFGQLNFEDDDVLGTFISKLKDITGYSFRLPTETEWEFAARGGRKRNGNKYAGAYGYNKVSLVQLLIDKGEITPEEAKYHPLKGKMINGLNDVAWYYENSGGTTHPVKQKMPNELGIYDMCGNVLEPCIGGVSKGGCYAFDKKDCQIVSRHDGSKTAMGCWFGLRLALSCE